jgi:hypothetical protein
VVLQQVFSLFLSSLTFFKEKNCGVFSFKLALDRLNGSRMVLYALDKLEQNDLRCVAWMTGIIDVTIF